MNKQEFKKMLLSGKISAMVQEATTGENISNPNAIYNVITPLVAQHPGIEKFYCIFTTAKNKTISIKAMFSGSLSSCAVYIREIIKEAIKLDAACIIAAHNHPSGDNTPSEQDIKLTRNLIAACRIMDIAFHDHIVIGDSGYTSIMSENLI
jgi:DNA repair protein RadC